MASFSKHLSTPLFACMTLASTAAGDFPADPLGWPAESMTHKPWTRWWWPGSAVDRTNLTRELEDFAKNGLGGVEICPIYGVMGAEQRFVRFLSPQWMEMLAHTTREARRLGLGVDMTTGTGWPFGGPQVTPEMASAGLEIISSQVTGGQEVRFELPAGTLQCLHAYPETGEPVDLLEYAGDGKLGWRAPAGNWRILGLSSRAAVQKVKRAAPGGEGHVLDPFSPSAMEHYLSAFDRAFEGFTAPMPRAQFHDSFEYYGAAWTPGLLEAFRIRRGYDLREQLQAFAGIGDGDTASRVRADYRETLGEMHRDYLRRWHDWAKSRGGITRNQAHGSPGNLLDHYAVSEIPETEIFRHVDENQIPTLRLAASAAHANGGTLVSSETFTWLGEHFQVTPQALKQAADFVFLGGVNHIFFHGIPYSPEDAGWPGWLFYASTHMGHNGGLWRDLSAFNGYVRQCQSILQDGSPDSEVLLYFPYADMIHGGGDKLPLFTIHNQQEWLWPTPFYRRAMELWEAGVTFDFASDEMLRRASVSDGRIILGNNRFKALVVSGVQRMPLSTMEALAGISSRGGKVLFHAGDLTEPPDVPGFHLHESRKSAQQALFAKHFGKSTGSLLAALQADCGITPEPMASKGLRFIRRRHDEGHHYFIVNRSDRGFDGSITLASPFKSAVILDPWHPEKSAVTRAADIPLRLAPGESAIIRTFTGRQVAGNPWTPLPAPARTSDVAGPWKIEFIAGGPELPAPAEAIQPGSWTKLPGTENFSGTARYTTTFDLASPPRGSCRIDLGRVAHTARVSLNGESLGFSWCPPHVIDAGRALKPGKNQLEIEVTNLAANRIADLDRRKVPWKRFHEINFVNIDYKPFDASSWPALESGLLGPVRLWFDE